jgi:hypothetical protein
MMCAAHANKFNMYSACGGVRPQDSATSGNRARQTSKVASYAFRSAEVDIELVEINSQTGDSVGACHARCVCIDGHGIVALKSRDGRKHSAKGIFHPIADPKVLVVVDPDGSTHGLVFDYDFERR